MRSGDRATIDGRGGILELNQVREVNVVTAFLEDGSGRILLLRRSSKVRSFPGWWAAISGTMERSSVLNEARREIAEEVGLRSGELRSPSVGRPLLVRHGNRILRIHPCRFRVRNPLLRVNWEHTSFAWIRPAEMARLRTVPKLQEAYRATREILPLDHLRQKE